MTRNFKAELERKRARLELYYQREEVMLSEDGVKSYGTGSQNATRYDTDLAEVRKAIKELEEDIRTVESTLNGERPNRVLGVIPRDW